jgi:hypothetical protein
MIELTVLAAVIILGMILALYLLFASGRVPEKTLHVAIENSSSVEQHLDMGDGRKINIPALGQARTTVSPRTTLVSSHYDSQGNRVEHRVRLPNEGVHRIFLSTSGVHTNIDALKSTFINKSSHDVELVEMGITARWSSGVVRPGCYVEILLSRGSSWEVLKPYSGGRILATISRVNLAPYLIYENNTLKTQNVE